MDKLKIMKKSLFLLLIIALNLAGCSQSSSIKNQTGKKVGGGCEGCEAIYESPVPFEKLNSVDTLPDFNEPGPKLEISGIVYQHDGKTPAKNVIIYVYHTDQSGNYTAKENQAGWGKRHGYIRGWMKTDKNGFYRFYTLRPAAYPGRNIPAHIHVTVKEPDKNEYWIDEYLFDEDPLLTSEERKKQEKRGGSGILKPADVGNMQKAERNIYLGKNIPDYPKQ